MRPRIITLFGSSQARLGSQDYAKARLLGKLLAQGGFVVCNGGYSGVMEASARGAKEGGGKTIGVTAVEFRDVHSNSWIDEERPQPTWRERLFELIRLGDGYIFLNGGTGTLVELACVWEMMRKRMMSGKPAVLAGGPWEKMLKALCRNDEFVGPPFFLTAKSVREAPLILKREFNSRLGPGRVAERSEVP